MFLRDTPRRVAWLCRRLGGVAVLTLATVAAWLPVSAPPATAVSPLSNPTWSTSRSTTAATGASYTYTFKHTGGATTLDSVTMTVPVGTGGSPTVGAVTPPAVAAGGTVTLSGTTLTYSFTPSVIPNGQPVSIQVNGLTNTAVAGSYTSTITTVSSGTAVESGTTPAVAFTSGALVNPAWSASSTTTGASGASYTYSFTTGTTSLLSSVTMTVPAGTAGSPTVGAVTPSALATGGSVALSGTTLTYSFTPASIIAGTAVSIQINGLTNTTVSGIYTSQIVTHTTAVAVDSGTTAGVTFGSAALGAPTWSASSTTTSYPSFFNDTSTTATTSSLSSVTMTVPPGTAGSPTVGAVTPSALATGGSVALSDTTLTYSFTPASIIAGTAVSIPINGLTNTATVGTYTSALTTQSGTGVVDAGTTPSITFSGILTLTSPSTLTWAATLNGTDQSVVDTVPAHQQLTVADT